jgi:hypothetical protein
MPKKITSLLTAAVMLLCLFIFPPGMALAADGTTWDGNAYAITEGSGTEADPYIIDTAGKLAFLAQHVTEADYQSKHYRLTQDLDLNGDNYNWVPIGNLATTSSGFQGYFDGNGHIISGMSAAHDQSGGLFGVISSATLKNLRVSGDASAVTTSTTGFVRSGGVVGIAENSIIINCYHSGNVISDTKQQNNKASGSGGIAGSISFSDIINCYHSGNVSANNPNFGDQPARRPNAGGVVGLIENGGRVEYCYWDNGGIITPSNAYGIGSATDSVANVVYFSGTPPTLGSEITVGGTNTNDLLTALNANLDEIKDNTLYKWKEAGGYPTFDSVRWSAPADGSITPSTAGFDKYNSAAGYADVTVTKSDGDHTLNGIYNGAAALAANTDYTIAGNTVTIKKEYLATLATGLAVLNFDYSGGTDPVLTITITDSTPVASSDATLSALTISSGTLSPAFVPGTTNYTANVAYSVSSVNVTPMVNQADAVVTVNGVTTASGTPSAVGLSVGTNTITILVTAQDNITIETYTISINRAAATDGSITPSTAGFDKYNSAAGYADVTVTKSDGDHTLNGIYNGAAALAANTDYTIAGNTVTIKKEYLATLATGLAVLNFDYSGGTDPVLTITITDSTPVASSDATLSALTISSGTLSPAFVPGTTNYTANVAYSVSSVNVTPMVNQADAVVTVNGVTTASGTPSAVVLSVGVNTIHILVTAQDATTTKTYTLTITRAAGSSSSGGGGGSSNYYTVSVDANSDNGEVTFDKTRSTAGSRVTITVNPDEGYQIDRLLILDKDGREVTYTNNGDGTYSFTMPSGDITVKAQFIEIPAVLPDNPPAFPFIDVGENDWYYQAVDYVYRNQLFAGTSEEHFEPKTPMSRAMLVTVLWRLEGQANIDINQVFSDVPAGEYYARAVDWANRQEIVKGYGDSRFGPLDNITREQMAVILYKFAEFKGYDTSAAADLGIFHDSSSVSSWARDAVKWAVASQILTGKGNGILDPSGNASRAEAASILMRLLTNQEG